MVHMDLHRQHTHARAGAVTLNGLCNRAELFIQQMAVKWERARLCFHLASQADKKDTHTRAHTLTL